MKTITFRDAWNKKIRVKLVHWPKQLTLFVYTDKQQLCVILTSAKARKIQAFLNQNLKNAKKSIKLPRLLDGDVET